MHVLQQLLGVFEGHSNHGHTPEIAQHVTCFQPMQSGQSTPVADGAFDFSHVFVFDHTHLRKIFGGYFAFDFSCTGRFLF